MNCNLKRTAKNSSEINCLLACQHWRIVHNEVGTGIPILKGLPTQSCSILYSQIFSWNWENSGIYTDRPPPLPHTVASALSVNSFSSVNSFGWFKMYKQFFVSSWLLFVSLFNLSQAAGQHFWSSIWNEKLPRPLVQEDFHQIISRFQDNFDRYERNFDKIWDQMKGDIKSKYTYCHT